MSLDLRIGGIVELTTSWTGRTGHILRSSSQGYLTRVRIGKLQVFANGINAVMVHFYKGGKPAKKLVCPTHIVSADILFAVNLAMSESDDENSPESVPSYTQCLPIFEITDTVGRANATLGEFITKQVQLLQTAFEYV